MARAGTAASLTAELEAALLRELVAEWRHVNRGYFRSRLVEPTFELGDGRSTLGRWIVERRAIEIARSLVLEHPWSAVIEVLKHEMAHQWVHEGLGLYHEAPHGQSFRETCARLGIDAAASGVPLVAQADDGEQRMLDRIAKLLALAESPNVHEAEAAMAAAQRLMLKHNLDVHAGAHARGYAFRHVGRVTGRVTESERTLARILAQHFFVEAIWVPIYRPLEAKRGSVVELCGSPANLEIAAYVHGYLSETAERLWRDHKLAAGLTGDRDRRAFLAGVMSGFAGKLAQKQKVHREQGLVWVGDRDLDDYLRRRHPYVRQVWSAGPRRNESFAHGHSAGAAIVLHKPVEGRAPSRGRLLPAKS